MSVLEQQIPEGFKRTDVGIIPEDWAVSPLFEVCGFGGGTTPPRSQHDRYFVGGSNNWIKTTDLNNSLIGTSEELITEEAISETGLKKHPVGTVLVAMYGGFNQIGRTGLITKPSAINQALVAVKPKPKKLDSYYLLSELNYNVDYWKGVASSSRKDPNITSNDVKNYKIALPSVEEQTAIANALSDVDALLTELEKLIAKKQAIKTATMQQLLTGKTRLPQFANYTEGEKQGQLKGTKSSELGEIPEDWETRTLKEMATSNGLVRGPFGGALKKEHFSKDGYKVYEQRNAIYGNTTMGNYFINQKKFDELKRFSVSSGDFIVSCSGTIGRIFKVPNECPKGVINQALLKITLNDSIDPDYFGHYFKWDTFQEKIIDGTQGGAMKNLVGMSEFKESLMPVPICKKEQTAIASILSDMDDEIQTLEQRLAKTRQIKQGMMQELLTGKTRLPFKKES